MTESNGRAFWVDVLCTLKHGRTFITSREKMHPVGVELYDKCIADVEARAAAPQAQIDTRASNAVVPHWIVNDLGELGVEVGGRFFFLYKGDNIEYGYDADCRSDGVAIHDDGTPMRYRMVGKREFGETCIPAAWWQAGMTQARYTQAIVFTPGISDGKPEDWDWRDLPASPTPRANLTEGNDSMNTEQVTAAMFNKTQWSKLPADLRLLSEAERLLMIAHRAMQKAGLSGLGSDCSLSHELRMFALEFSRAERTGPGELQVNGFGSYAAWRDAVHAYSDAVRAAEKAVDATLDAVIPSPSKAGDDAS